MSIKDKALCLYIFDIFIHILSNQSVVRLNRPKRVQLAETNIKECMMTCSINFYYYFIVIYFSIYSQVESCVSTMYISKTLCKLKI